MSPAKKDEDNVLIQETKKVSILSVVPYDKNPRVGDIDEIAKSLQANKMFKPLIVNRRDNQILAGNHTYLAARKLGWKEILVSYVDVDEDAAKRIVLADNRTSDLGAYDIDALTELLSSLEDPSVGTGYNEDELAELLNQVEEDSDDLDETLDDIDEANEEAVRTPTVDTGTLDDDEPSGEDAADLARPGIRTADPEAGPLETASEKLGGVVELQALPEFDGVGDWGIPRLLDDMLMTFDELPANLDSWAGSATKNWPHKDQWWLYNYGIDSTAGMEDISKVIVSFYCFDDYFEKWWTDTDKMVTRLLNSKIQYMVTPDFSMHENRPPVFWLFQLYRARWVARYAQEAGIKVIPNVSWPDGARDYLIEHVCGTLPKNLPMIAFQMQTIDWDLTAGGKAGYIDIHRDVIDALNPQSVLVYAGPQGREVLPEILPKDMPVKIVRTRMEKLSVAAKMRQKKTTL